MTPASASIISNLRKLASHAGFQKYFVNTGWLFAEKILRLGAGLFVGAYVARYLGPSQYGLLNYVISVVAIFNVVADFGIESVVTRELVRNSDGREKLMGTAFLLKSLGSLASISILLLFVHFTTGDKQVSTLFFVVAIGIITDPFRIIEFYFNARVLSKFVVWSQMTALAAVSVYRIGLVQMNASLEWFAWSYTFDLALFAIGYLFFYQKTGHAITGWKFDKNLALTLIKTSWPLIFASLAVIIYMKIDQVMIRLMLGDAANGHYGVAVRLSEMWNFIAVAICASVFPSIIQSKDISEELYLQRLQWLYDLMIFLALAIAIPFTFLAPFVIQVLFGEAFSAAATITSIYIWSGLFVFVGVANGKWLINENLHHFRMTTLIIAAGLNIILNYALINLIGLNGAAVSTLISYCFAAYLCLFFSRKTRPMFYQLTRSLNLFTLPKRLVTGLSSLK